MKDRARQVVEFILNAPDILEALNCDPKLLAAKCGISDKAVSLLEAGHNLIESYVNRAPGAKLEPPNVVVRTGGTQPRTSCGSGKSALWTSPNSVPVVGVVGLASIGGMLSAAAVVAVVAINKDE